MPFNARSYQRNKARRDRDAALTEARRLKAIATGATAELYPGQAEFARSSYVLSARFARAMNRVFLSFQRI